MYLSVYPMIEPPALLSHCFMLNIVFVIKCSFKIFSNDYSICLQRSSLTNSYLLDLCFHFYFLVSMSKAIFLVHKSLWPFLIISLAGDEVGNLQRWNCYVKEYRHFQGFWYIPPTTPQERSCQFILPWHAILFSWRWQSNDTRLD